MTGVSETASGSSPQTIKRLLGFALAAFFFLVFSALGTWQVFRLQEKLALIERVETRVNAPAVQAPGPTDWPQVTRDTHEYLSVQIQGEFMAEFTTRIQATTALGAGHWLMTPLKTAYSSIVWINRGFIAPGQEDSLQTTDPGRQFRVIGLLRISEEGRAFLRRNSPADNRWYARDVAALSSHHQLDNAAPYFIDAGRPRNLGEEITGFAPKSYPVDGLTIIKFHNSHLVYAFTWYALALMVAGVTFWLARR